MFASVKIQGSGKLMDLVSQFVNLKMDLSVSTRNVSDQITVSASMATLQFQSQLVNRSVHSVKMESV